MPGRYGPQQRVEVRVTCPSAAWWRWAWPGLRPTR